MSPEALSDSNILAAPLTLSRFGVGSGEVKNRRFFAVWCRCPSLMLVTGLVEARVEFAAWLDSLPENL
jgi:hypothetical protein